MVASDNHGEVFLEKTVRADTILRPNTFHSGGEDFSVIDLRLAVPRRNTDEVLRALRLGKVEITSDAVPSGA